MPSVTPSPASASDSPALRLALATPVVINVPGAHAEWERTGTIEDVALFAEAADRAGYHHIICSEHVGVPSVEAERRGARYWDPLATFGHLSARTTRLGFATNVLVLGYHHPLAIAKRYGTLDVVSGGRLVLGLGVGSLQEEFDLLDAPFEDRGARADDALRALRASLSENEPSYSGTHHEFGDFTIDPCAQQDRVPLWVGGRTLRSLRRAVELGDGWTPFAITGEQAAAWLERVDLPADFEIVLSPDHALDPIAEPDAAVAAIGAVADTGATIVRARLDSRDASHLAEQVEALAALDHGARMDGYPG